MLTERECRTAEKADKDRKLFDGGGLHLLIKPSGYKSWRLKYRFGGKEKQLTFGPYPTITLREARGMRDEAKRQLLDGCDPGVKGREIRNRRAGRVDEDRTFKAAALRWHKLQEKGWKERHAARVLVRLQQDAFPHIGGRLLNELRPSDIRLVIDAMQERGSIDQANRMLTRISQIFKLAIVRDEVEINPAASLSAILQPVANKKYRALLDIEQARAALKAFETEAHQPTTKLASRLLALTASRPGPLRLAAPTEFVDLDGTNPRWIIPAAKMKLERVESEQAAFDFTIPLSTQAVATVKAALAFAGDRTWLFPSVQNGTRPISDNALNVAYRRSTSFADRHVPHGWRSSFSTIMNERAAELDRPGDRAIIDLMLAHKPRGSEAHYNRAAYMPRRRLLAQEWADLLSFGLPEPAALLNGPRR
jgi:hypothetical protein